MVTACCVSVLTKRVATILTSSTSPFRNRSRASVRDRPGLGELGGVAVGKLGNQLPPRSGDELRGLASGRDEDGRLRIVPSRQTEHVAVERAAEALVACDQNDGALLDGAHLQQRMLEIDRPRRRLPLHAIQEAEERPHVDGGLLGLAHLRRGHHLHGLGDLCRAADGADPPAEFACARHGSRPEQLELLGGVLQLAHQRIVQRLAFDDVAEQGRFRGRQELGEPAWKFLDALHGDVVDVAVLHHPENGHLNLDRNGVVLRLVEQLDDALAAVDLGLRRRIQVRAELREGGQFAELRQVAFEPSGHLLHRLDLGGRPDAGDRDARPRSPGECPGRTDPFPGRSGRR